MRSLCAALAVILLLGVAPASAAIRITDSRYENGVLILTGQTRPNQKVTLDSKYTTKSDATGRFAFSVKYRPPTCMSDIASGEDSYSAIITNCLLGDAAASSDPALNINPKAMNSR